MRLRPRLALLLVLAVAAPVIPALTLPAFAQEATAEMPPMPQGPVSEALKIAAWINSLR